MRLLLAMKSKKKIGNRVHEKKMASNLVKSFFFKSCEIMEFSSPPPHTRTKTQPNLRKNT